LSLKDIIKEQDFFKTLNEKQIERLTSFTTLHQYEKEYILYYERQESHELCFLVKGLAKAYKFDKHDNEIFLYYIYESSMISELSNIAEHTLRSFSNIS